MPVNRPQSDELVQSVREMLEQQLLPALEDKALIYQCRVSINILKIVERELSSGAAMLQAEQERLAALLGENGEQGELDAMNEQLVQRIRAGEFDQMPAELLAHFLATTLDKMAIDNPGYSTYLEYQQQGTFSNY